MRYEVTIEVTKVGRKTEKQFCVYDTLEDRVVVRFAQEKDAKGVIAKYEASKG
jgi:hypothetical protein